MKCPSHFSFSALNSYRKCPYQYKLSTFSKSQPKAATILVLVINSLNFAQVLYTNTDLKQRHRPTCLGFGHRSSACSQRQQAGLRGGRVFENGEVKVPHLMTCSRCTTRAGLTTGTKAKTRKTNIKKGKDILKGLYESNKDKWTIPVALERGFKLKVGIISSMADGPVWTNCRTALCKSLITKPDSQKEKLRATTKSTFDLSIGRQFSSRIQNLGAVSNLTFSIWKTTYRFLFWAMTRT